MAILVLFHEVSLEDIFASFFTPELNKKRLVRKKNSFQQDGTTAHTVNVVMHYFRTKFRGRVILRNDDIAWPARSPDLSICDFWGYLKSKVFTNIPGTPGELKEAKSFHKKCWKKY